MRKRGSVLLIHNRNHLVVFVSTVKVAGDLVETLRRTLLMTNGSYNMKPLLLKQFTLSDVTFDLLCITSDSQSVVVICEPVRAGVSASRAPGAPGRFLLASRV